MLSRYAAIVKNLRGVVVFDPEEGGSLDAVNWLARRFRYRNLGAPPSLIKQAPAVFEGRLGGNPFVELAHPAVSTEALTGIISASFGVDRTVAEAVVLASVYVSPVLAVGRVAEALAPLSAGTVESRVRMTAFLWKLHLRIADYTVLDLFSWSTQNAELLWEGKLEGVVNERAAKIEKDKRRYWRLAQGAEQPRTFLTYVDVAQAVAKQAMWGNKAPLKAVTALPRGEASAGMAIIAAVSVPTEAELLP